MASIALETGRTVEMSVYHSDEAWLVPLLLLSLLFVSRAIEWGMRSSRCVVNEVPRIVCDVVGTDLLPDSYLPWYLHAMYSAEPDHLEWPT